MDPTGLIHSYISQTLLDVTKTLEKELEQTQLNEIHRFSLKVLFSDIDQKTKYEAHCYKHLPDEDPDNLWEITKEPDLIETDSWGPLSLKNLEKCSLEEFILRNQRFNEPPQNSELKIQQIKNGFNLPSQMIFNAKELIYILKYLSSKCAFGFLDDALIDVKNIRVKEISFQIFKISAKQPSEKISFQSHYFTYLSCPLSQPKQELYGIHDFTKSQHSSCSQSHWMISK